MSTPVVASGCDFLGKPAGYSDEGSVIVGTAYGGFTDPAGDISDTRSSTNMGFCCRYIARPGAGTGLITVSELNNLNLAGVQVVFICENVNIQSPTAFANAAAAFAQGQSDATTCQNNLQSVIGTPNWVVYFCADYDYNGALYDFFSNYMQGASSVMGAANTGLYGDGTLWANSQSPPYPTTHFWQSRSAGWSGNGALVAGQNLWQWPIISGYTPSGNVTLTGTWGSAAVDGDLAITSSYGQYPGTGGTGVETNATITNPVMIYTQPAQQTISVPQNKYDRVLYSNVWSTSLTESSWPNSINAPATNINQYAYPIGTFNATVNGVGLSTNDFGVLSQAEGGYGQFPGDLPLVFVQPFIDGSGNLSFEITYTPGGPATIDLVISYALLAYPNASEVPIQSTAVEEAFANVYRGPKSYSTYRRIALDNSIGTGGNSVVHNQSTVPNLLFWVQDNTGDIEVQAPTWTNTGPFVNHFGLSMDATSVYFYVDSINNTKCWYRIYEDN
jgi:hypothetical protein